MSTEDFKRLPTNVEAEKAIISLAFLAHNSDYLLSAFEILKPRDFYDTTHQQIWEALMSLKEKGDEIDIITVSDEVKKQNIDSKQALEAILNAFNTPSVVSGNMMRFAELIRDCSVLRRFIGITNNATEDAYLHSTEPKKLITEHEKELINLMDTVVDKRPNDIEGIIEEVNVSVENTIKNGWRGVNTLWKGVDKCTGGLIPTHVWVVGAYCMGKGTKIRLSNGGFKSIEDIKKGDLLAPVLSKTPRKVLETVSGIDEMYEITGKYINTFTVNSNHVLPMVWVGDGYVNNVFAKVYNLTVTEFLKKSRREQRGFKLLKETSEFKPKNLPVPPWLLGFWLGDGRSKGTRFTVSKKETEIISELQKLSNDLNLRYVEKEWKNNGVLDIGLCRFLGDQKTNRNKLLDNLRKIGVINNKHIPDTYLQSSKNQRLNLLAGLIDSDGSISGENKTVVTFTQVNKLLINQVQELSESLGFNTSIKKQLQKGGSTLVKNKGCGYIWKLFITGRVSQIPNRVRRKKGREAKFLKRIKWGVPLSFKIKPIGKGRYYGFKLDGNHLYLAENNVVNHNTGTGKSFFLLQLTLNILRQGKKVVLFSTEMDRKMNMLRLIGMICNIRPIEIMRGEMDDYQAEKYEEAKEELKSYKNQLFIFDNVNTIAEIRLKTKKLKLEHNIDVVMIDFIQNLKGPGKIYERMSEASIELQEMAQLLQVCLIVASQISQNSAEWKEGSSQALEYKGAGEIGAMADVGLWLSKLSKKEQEKQGLMDVRTADGGVVTYRNLILRKVRHGEPGMSLLRMDFPSGTVSEIQEGEQAKPDETYDVLPKKEGGEDNEEDLFEQ